MDKSRNLFKFVSVLLSVSVERVCVSRMRDFFFFFQICQAVTSNISDYKHAQVGESLFLQSPNKIKHCINVHI